MKHSEYIKGTVFNIQHFSVRDGPGIRTVVFLKGCPLRCYWCGNPESQNIKRELMWTETKCIGCKSCKKVDLNDAITFGKENIGNKLLNIKYNRLPEDVSAFDNVCPAEALQIVGKVMGVTEVIDMVEEDSLFYGNSNGGITLSGGEPLLQSEYSIALLKEAKRREINTAIETTGFISWDVFKEAGRNLDYLLYDLKILDDEKHKKYVGVSNKLIKENLKRIREEYKELPIKVRTPVIPGINDSDNDIKEICGFIDTINNVEYELLPYHKLGVSKYKSLGRKYQMPDVELTNERLDELNNLIIKWRK